MSGFPTTLVTCNRCHSTFPVQGSCSSCNNFDHQRNHPFCPSNLIQQKEELAMQVSDLQVENDALKAELELWRKDPEGAMVKGLNKSLHAAKEELAAEQSQTAQLKEEIQVWEEIVAGLEARLEEALKL